MDKKKQFAIAAVTTGRVFPKIWETYDEAEQYRMRRQNPENWKVVCREITYGEWK